MNKADFLKSRGWHQWYNDNYWCNPRIVENPKEQDHTDYGMSLELAYRFEVEGWPPFPSVGFAGLSMMVHAIDRHKK